MAENSKIEWTDASWTPIRARNKATGKVGWHCEHATTGCVNCYAESMNLRLGTGLPFKPGHRKDIEIFQDDDMLLAPLKWKRPRMVFVCSMTDLFADFVPDEWIDKIFAVMALCPQHTFQVLTKRSARMREYFEDDDRAMMIGVALGNMLDGDWIWKEGKQFRKRIDHLISLSHGMADDDVSTADDEFLPLKNVWLGVSAERQEEWDERVCDLGATPAAVRFVSAEPLLGPIDVGNAFDPTSDDTYHPVDWVIVGGESGPGARPMHPDWARSIRDQCQAAAAFFFKQWGAWAPGGVTHRNYADGEYATIIAIDGTLSTGDKMEGGPPRPLWCPISRVGKGKAGRLLDGREWNEMPALQRAAAGERAPREAVNT